MRKEKCIYYFHKTYGSRISIPSVLRNYKDTSNKKPNALKPIGQGHLAVKVHYFISYKNGK